MKIFISRLLFLSNEEKEKGLKNKSNIIKFYTINELSLLLNKDNKKTYYEHLYKSKLRFVIDLDNVIDIKIIKNSFSHLYNIFKFFIPELNKTNFIKNIALSKSKDLNNYHLVCSNILFNIDDLIFFTKILFKQILLDIFENKIDFSIYKKNFNLRMIYSIKQETKKNILLPITNNKLEDHFVTYIDNNKINYLINLKSLKILNQN